MDKRSRPAERVRLRKEVLTEEVTITVLPRERVWLEKDVETSERHFTQTVRREEPELDREPSSGGETEREHQP